MISLLDVRVEVVKSMMPGAWIVYGRNDEVIACGHIGAGSRTEKPDGIARRIACSQEAFDALMEQTKERPK